MSKVSQELKALLFLHRHRNRTQWVRIGELSDYLEVTPRQARRYIEDLANNTEFDIRTRLGRNGGYRLFSRLDDGLALPENLVLAMSVAMRHNERIESVLSRLPNYVISTAIEGDNFIDSGVLDRLEVLLEAITDQKEIIFSYRDYPEKSLVQPYRIALTNHAYYLFGVSKDGLRKYDVQFMEDIQILGQFKANASAEEQIRSSLSSYGIKGGTGSTLRVRCKDSRTLMKFNRYFEGKGKIDEQELTFVVSCDSENELYYPLFRISTKQYEFLDGEFKKKYLDYLKAQIKSIESK